MTFTIVLSSFDCDDLYQLTCTGICTKACSVSLSCIVEGREVMPHPLTSPWYMPGTSAIQVTTSLALSPYHKSGSIHPTSMVLKTWL